MIESVRPFSEPQEGGHQEWQADRPQQDCQKYVVRACRYSPAQFILVIYKEYLHHTLGLTLWTPGLVKSTNDKHF